MFQCDTYVIDNTDERRVSRRNLELMVIHVSQRASSVLAYISAYIYIQMNNVHCRPEFVNKVQIAIRQQQPVFGPPMLLVAHAVIIDRYYVNTSSGYPHIMNLQF